MSEVKEKTPTVSYYETRAVNIGDYENVGFCLTISGVTVKHKGRGNKSAEITAAEKKTVTDEFDLDETVKFVVSKVQSKLNAIEKKIRLQTADWSGMAFDTEAKAIKRKVVEKDYEFQNHFGKRMELDED